MWAIRRFNACGAARGERIGHALLLASLHDRKVMGYGYAIIGDVGPSGFSERTVGATEIPNSAPGVFADMLMSAE